MHQNMLKDALDLWKESRKGGNGGTSLRMRLLVFFLVFLLAVISGFLLIFSITGNFNSKLNECHRWTENELDHVSQNVNNDFGKLSMQGIEFSQLLSSSIEKDMQDHGISPSELSKNTNELEPLLNNQINIIVSMLKQVRASGVYVILDATVNPELPNSNYSKSGVFLKCTEPNIINSNELYVKYLRGPSKIAIDHGIQLLPQWKMEFDISYSDFFTNTIKTAIQSDLPVSRLYYWSDKITLKDNSESGMLLSVPLIASDGTVFGVCGFEVSSMLFKLEYSPSNGEYCRVFSLLAPEKDGFMNQNKGLIAGNGYFTNSIYSEKLAVGTVKDGFDTYSTETSTRYIGITAPLSLYPKDSAYSDMKWNISILFPEEDITTISKTQRQKVIIAFLIVFVISIIFADFFSRRYIKPVLNALNSIKINEYSSISKTRILEIDDLIEFLSAQDEKTESQPEETFNKRKKNTSANKQLSGFSAYQEFVSNISTLSAAEKAVFNLYMEGHSATEIADILCLSINTIKTHNRRIYTKLNVTSRKELMVYVGMIKEAESEITN